jgi:hypothetical protein|tara:strand:- start:463 stop:702 length:240 start_codon:yes stop_codon:yes gene_type:complete
MSRRCKITPLACKICKENVAKITCSLCEKIICVDCLNDKICKSCSMKFESFRKPVKVLQEDNAIEVTVKGKKCWNCINI